MADDARGRSTELWELPLREARIFLPVPRASARKPSGVAQRVHGLVPQGIPPHSATPSAQARPMPLARARTSARTAHQPLVVVAQPQEQQVPPVRNDPHRVRRRLVRNLPLRPFSWGRSFWVSRRPRRIHLRPFSWARPFSVWSCQTSRVRTPIRAGSGRPIRSRSAKGWTVPHGQLPLEA